MDLGLSGATALVTGGSKGIGRATAQLLAEEGCDLAIVARGQEQLKLAADEIAESTGQRVIPLAGDMSQQEDVDRCAQRAIEELGGLDVLITCAGSSPGGLLEELTEDEWLSSLNLKFMGYVRTCTAVLPHMRERGRGTVVLVVGNDGVKPSWWELTAGAANAADINFASSIAEQYGRHGVRVNTVNPGPVETDRWGWLLEQFASDKKVSLERAEELAMSSIPLGRIATAEEVANVTVFLASPRASFVNGAHLVIDGGQQKAIMGGERMYGSRTQEPGTRK